MTDSVRMDGWMEIDVCCMICCILEMKIGDVSFKKGVLKCTVGSFPKMKDNEEDNMVM
jgi:hypothetical protein